MDLDLLERTELLAAVETQSHELSKAFIRYRETENAEGPEIDDEKGPDKKDWKLLVDIYYSHRMALEAILDCAGKLKKAIENLEAYFVETEEDKKRKKRIAEAVKKHKEELRKRGKTGD